MATDERGLLVAGVGRHDGRRLCIMFIFVVWNLTLSVPVSGF